MEENKSSKLESLPEETQEWLLEIASGAERLSDCMEPLKERGIEVSLSTFTRFVREHRRKQTMQARADLKESAEQVVNETAGETFRKGALELVRQQLFEKAMEPNSSEEARKLYNDLLREESKLKELELAERRLQLAEQQVRLERSKMRVRARRINRGTITASEIVEIGGKAVAQLPAPSEREAKLEAALKEVEAILNRGANADPMDRVVEARTKAYEALAT